jgi:ribosomal protein L40E
MLNNKYLKRVKIKSVYMPKQRFPEAEGRLFHRVFVCMNCGAKIRADLAKVRANKIRCRNCKSKDLRPIHKEHKV